MMLFTVMMRVSSKSRKPVAHVYAYSANEAIKLCTSIGITKSFDVEVSGDKLPIPTLCPVELVCAAPDELATEAELEARAALEAQDAH